jgi:two-component system LytT family response regulator
MIRCIAIDDEPLALRQVKSYISKIPTLELVAACSNATEAQTVLDAESVDLLFVDINMPDINGIDFVRGLENPPMVIFTTAYSEYAIEGFRLDAVDYLLKPFAFSEFNKAVDKACSLFELIKLRDGKTAGVEYEAVAPETETDEDYISVKADYKVTLVRHADIIYLESVGEYVRLHLTNGSTITTLFRLKNMESLLPERKFMRIHRSYIINLSHLTSFTRGKVYLSCGDDLPVGANYREAFREYAERLGE